MSRAPVAGKMAIVLLAVLSTSCSMFGGPPRTLPVNHFRSDPRDFDTVRRVMVLPFGSSTGAHPDTGQVRQALLNELTKLQRFEVVPLPSKASEHAVIETSLARGRLATDALVALSERYQIDGVLVGTITSFRPYPPMNLGLRLQLVSLHSGRTVWAAEGIYDANDARVLEDVEHYALTFAAHEASLHGWELNLIAPQKYASYVAHRLVASCR